MDILGGNFLFGYLLLLLLIVPLAELALLIKIGQNIGTIYTVFLVIITGVIGALFAKYQGIKVLWELRYNLSQNIMPGIQLLEGIFVLLGGILLLTPGLITDILGLLFLLPFTRNSFVKLTINWLENHMRSGKIRIYRR